MHPRRMGGDQNVDLVRDRSRLQPRSLHDAQVTAPGGTGKVVGQVTVILASVSAGGLSFQTQKSVWPRPAPGDASCVAGAGPSQTTLDLPRSSLPVTTRRIGCKPYVIVAPWDSYGQLCDDDYAIAATGVSWLAQARRLTRNG